jgi:hypothetical protein
MRINPTEVIRKAQQIEKIVVETALQSLNDAIVEQRCGEKSTQGNGQKQFRRVVTTTSNPVMIPGELNL